MMKKYIQILSFSLVPFLLEWLCITILDALFLNPFLEIGSWVLASIISELIILVAVNKLEQRWWKKILLVLLMPTFYVFPILLLIISVYLNADWGGFNL